MKNLLQWLDRRLEQAIATAHTVYGPEALADPYRGLHISRGDVMQILETDPTVPVLQGDNGAEATLVEVAEESQLGWLGQVYNLSAFELSVVVMAIAPELNQRYERLYAYLQNDVSRKRPTVDLALNLLSTTMDEQWSNRSYFASEAPLVREAIIHLKSANVSDPLLGQSFQIDPQILHLLLEIDTFDPWIADMCEWVIPNVELGQLPLPLEQQRSLGSLLHQARVEDASLRFYFQGSDGTGKRATVEAIAAAGDMALLVVNLSQIAQQKQDSLSWQRLFHRVFREAWFRDALVYVEDFRVLLQDEKKLTYQQFLKALANHAGITVIAGESPWPGGELFPLEIISVQFSVLDFAQRQVCWRSHLKEAAIELNDSDLEILASRFRLTSQQIMQTVASACSLAQWRLAALEVDSVAAVTLDDLFAAARTQSGKDLETLAQKVTPVNRWEDLVLPEEALMQLQEICQRVAQQQKVLGTWGFDRKLSLGKGINVLFAGASGTGKTMAAEVIAHGLGLDLYKIDLSGVVSKYIGETEKNLDRIFRAAENANAILFFDEADALFGKRSEVRDSHDRYANLEISYLLQKMEQYDGIAILATNLRGNLDEAFLRRLAFTVQFPMPDEVGRRQIWAGVWPGATPLAEDVDLDDLAHRFNWSGGNIKNIALAAAFLAAADDSPVGMRHLLKATQREYQKLGKRLSDEELTGVVNGDDGLARRRR